MGNGSPLLIGALVRGGMPLRSLMSVLVPAAYLLCSLLFWRAGQERRAEGLALKTSKGS